MKHASILCILCLLLLAATCKKQNKLENALLGKTWLHSFEEDEGEITVYRPNTYDFAPSRGRTGFELEKGNVIKRYEIAETDGLQEQTGHWTFAGKNTINVRFEGNDKPEESYSFEIVSLKDEVLKIRRKPVTQ